MGAHRFVAAIDFDHTIHNPEDRERGFKMGKPFAGAKEALTRLGELGAKIVIHTCRATDTAEHVAAWLDYFEIPYDEITALKPMADVYVDDRAVPFLGDWADTERELLALFYLGERP